jgi:hypothetical protein
VMNQNLRRVFGQKIMNSLDRLFLVVL